MAYNFIHEDTFDGSLLPLSTLHKAMWGWICSKARPDSRAPGGGSVLLNPAVLRAYFPDQTEDAIAAVIEEFCAVDPRSRTTDVEGRRLIPMGRDRYAVTTYHKHAGSRLARDAERKKEWRRQQKAQAEPPDPAASPAPAAPLVPPSGGATPPTHVPRGTSLTMSPREYHRLSETHAFVGDRIRIPNALHAQLTVQLGDPTPERNAWLLRFYQELNETRDPNETIPNIFKWVQARFEAKVKPAVTSSDTPEQDDPYLRSLDRSTARHETRTSTQE